LFGGFTDLGERPKSPAQELRIALAGPAVSAVLGTLMIVVSPWFGIHTYVAGRVNLLITAFNLLPIFPLDGGRALRAVLWKALGNYDEGTQRAWAFGRVIAYAVIMFGVALMVNSILIPALVVVLIGWRLRDLLGQDLRTTPSVSFRHDRPHVV
jgi:Zn-dependent protease